MKTLQENNVLKILIVAGLTLWKFGIVETLGDNSYALTDEEYKFSLGKDYVFFEIMEPEQLAYTYKANPAVFAPAWNHSHSLIPLVPTEPACGCGKILNSEEVEGNIALIERGECSFVSKVVRAQEAGAVGVIVTDEDTDNDELFISMADDTTGREANIPAAFVLGKNGYIIKNTLSRLSLHAATINIPVNISNIDIHKINQPPWVVW